MKDAESTGKAKSERQNSRQQAKHTLVSYLVSWCFKPSHKAHTYFKSEYNCKDYVSVNKWIVLDSHQKWSHFCIRATLRRQIGRAPREMARRTCVIRSFLFELRTCFWHRQVDMPGSQKPNFSCPSVFIPLNLIDSGNRKSDSGLYAPLKVGILMFWWYKIFQRNV